MHPPRPALPPSPTSPRSTGSRTSGRRYGGSRAPTPSTAPRRWPRAARRSSPSTPRRPPRAASCTWATCSPTRTPTAWRATSGCRGFEVFYPIGWDDNGLPTEKRVQNYYGVRGDASLPYVEGFEPPHRGDAKSLKAADTMPISRQNFIELCDELTVEDEKAFESLFRRMGFSLDWDDQLPHHRRPLARHRPAGLPAQPRPRRGLPVRGARACGTSPSRPPSPRPSSRPATTPAPTTASPSTAPTARSTSRPPAPS